MRVVDLLLEHSLQLWFQTPSAEERLAREVSGCSPTELMDPTPYLDPHALLLTSGIAMNFSEPRTWDAFVERLAEVPVSAIAFATGMAHRVLPPGPARGMRRTRRPPAGSALGSCAPPGGPAH